MLIVDYDDGDGDYDDEAHQCASMMMMVARYGEVHLGENDQAELYLPHWPLGPSQDDGDTREKGKDV